MLIDVPLLNRDSILSNIRIVEILDRTFSTKQRVRTDITRTQQFPHLTGPAGTQQYRACHANRISQKLGMKPIATTAHKQLVTKYSHLRRVLRATIPTLINS